jgi:hypothetical protein
VAFLTHLRLHRSCYRLGLFPFLARVLTSVLVLTDIALSDLQVHREPRRETGGPRLWQRLAA